MIKQLVLFASVLILLCVNAFAAPTISSIVGTVTHNGSISISGVDFEAKASAAPFLWDNFEAGTHGNTPVGEFPTIPAAALAWSNIFAGCNPIYSNSVLRQNSTLSVRLQLVPGCTGRTLMQNGTVPLVAESKIYFTYWQYLDESAETQDQFKGPRVLYYVSGYNDYFNTHTTLQGADWNWQWQCLYDGNQASAGSPDTLSVQPSRLKWHRWEFQAQVSSAALTADGKMKMMISRDNFSGAISVEADVSNITTIPVGGEIWDSFWLGQWENDIGSEVNAYFDDVYFDTTWQRVEIGDNATYASCTHREIQIPTVWADGSITFTANTSGFTSAEQGAGLYLFVVDSTGAASSGYRIQTGIIGVGTGPNSISVGEGPNTISITNN